MNPETADIYEYVGSHNPNCELGIHTNGGGRSKEFWQHLAKIGVRVCFSIDGLEDTNHLYRRNVEWSKVMDNADAFIKAGGKADWKWLIFKHNEHQVEEARTLADKMGFDQFVTSYSDRWKEYNWVTGDVRDITKFPVDDYFIEKPTSQEEKYYVPQSTKVSDVKFNNTSKINCWACKGGKYEIYLRANGNVQPCCMLGELEIHESKELIKDFDSINLNKTSLEDILNGEYFKLLQQGIDGEPGSHRLKNCFYSCGV
jgi:MoaA/NifB/PqqE/SkfB family radical SAM enzyme